MDNYTKAIVKKRMDKLYKRGLLEDKRIVLFGAAFATKEIKTFLLEYGLEPYAVIDNDTRKIGLQCMALTVKRPDEVLLPFNKDITVLFYSNSFFREITYQLEAYGYKSGVACHVLNDKVDEGLRSFAYLTALNIRGLLWCKKLVKGLGSNATVFIAPYTGTGDIYLAGLFFNEYLRRNNIDEYVFVVVSGACKKVAEMFDIRNIRVVTPQVSDDIINVLRFFKSETHMVVLNDGWGRDIKQWVRGYKGLNFEKVFRYFVFGFDDSVAFELPPKKDNGAAVAALFDKYKLIRGKTVLLSPYSNTLFELPKDFWEAIASYYISRGYVVCTNCAAKTEKAVNGTVEVFFTFGVAIDFLDACGTFIGIRSGLCDIISSSSCRKVILYEKDGLFYKGTSFDYFSLKAMGLCDDALELLYSDELRDSVLEEIFEC